MVCNRKAGFYYDKLLKKCINCATVCGQHPKQCDPSCGCKAVCEGRGSGGLWGRVPRGAGLKEEPGYGVEAREEAANPAL